MIPACKHQGAAESVRWMVGLLKGKIGADRAQVLSSLRTMVTSLPPHFCQDCRHHGTCRHLAELADLLLGEVAAAEPVPVVAAPPPGPLAHRRTLIKRRREALKPAPPRY